MKSLLYSSDPTWKSSKSYAINYELSFPLPRSLFAFNDDDETEKDCNFKDELVA